MLLRVSVSSGLLALLLCGCPRPTVRPTPRPPPPPLPIRVPAGCETPIDGLFRHAQQPAFRYRAEDDGGTLTLFVDRPAADGGQGAHDDAGTVVTLRRTPNGFTGETDALVFTQRGIRCRVAFPTDVAACSDAGLTLRSASSASVDDACRQPARPPPAPRVEHQLIRVVAGPMPSAATDDGAPKMDASSPDAGAVSADAGVVRPDAGPSSPARLLDGGR